jgi:hypothetical protein
MVLLSQDQAKGLISDIRAKMGGISPEVRARTPREALEALHRLAEMTAAATMTYSLSTIILMGHDAYLIIDFPKNSTQAMLDLSTN